MESLLLAGVLMALVVTLLRQSTSPEPSTYDARSNWPREAALLAASAGAAFLAGREALESWLAASGPGSALRVYLGWIAILPLAAAAIFAFGTLRPSASPVTPMAAPRAPTQPERTRRPMLSAALIVGVLLTVLVFSSLSSTISGWVTGLVLGKPQVAASSAPTGDDIGAAPASSASAQVDAIDEVVRGLVSSANNARAAAAPSETNVKARQAARNALIVIASALATDPGKAYRALAQAQHDFQSSPQARELLAQISRAEFDASQPSSFVEAGMAAWEQAAAIQSTTPQPQVAKVNGSRSDRARRADGAQNGNSHAFGAETQRSDLNDARSFSRQRDERRSPEWHPRVQQLPSDEFQR